MKKIKILLVEDDPLFGAALRDVLDDSGYTVRIAANGAEALEAITEGSFDLVLQDIRLPDANGLDVLNQITSGHPHTGSIVMTGYGTIDDAVKAMKLGAFDFLVKPFPMESLLLKIESYLEYRRVGKESGQHPKDSSPFSMIVTRSPAMLAALEIASKVASTPAPILLQGESGTGKDLVAEAIHKAGERSQGPYIQVNCAAIPVTLLESELFGIEKGAYTGADKSRPGYIEMASGGTLFLDEIGDLPLDLQGKLLRALEERGAARIGGTTFRNIDFRLITASNRDLSEMVKRGEFRKDLFFRINVIVIKLPALRERREDIPLLLAHFIENASSNTSGKPVFTPETLNILSHYKYPGNVRELKNFVERMVLLYPGLKVQSHHLPSEMQTLGVIGKTFESFDIGKPLKEAVTDYERKYIEKVVHYAGGRKQVAAKMLGLSRKVLWEKLKK